MAEFSQPKVPNGLRDLMKDLIKEVLKHKPDDIYRFAEMYFEEKLSQKQKFMVKNFENPKSNYDFSNMEWNYKQRYDIPIAIVYSIIPEDLTELIKNLIKAVLREQPTNLCEFCYEFFHHIRESRNSEREHHSGTTSYTCYENYLHNSEQYCKPYIRCVCGRIFRSGFITGIPSAYPCQIASHRRYDDKNQNKHHTTHNGVEDDNGSNNLKEGKESNDGKSRVTIYSNDYLKAVCVIQQYCRRYLKRKVKTTEIATNATNITMTLESAVILIQRWLRRLLNKRRSIKAKTMAVESPLLLKISEMDNDNLSETASYTSASTAVLSTDNDTENSERTVIESNKSRPKSTTNPTDENTKNASECLSAQDKIIQQEPDMDSVNVAKEEASIETMMEGLIDNLNENSTYSNQYHKSEATHLESNALGIPLDRQNESFNTNYNESTEKLSTSYSSEANTDPSSYDQDNKEATEIITVSFTPSNNKSSNDTLLLEGSLQMASKEKDKGLEIAKEEKKTEENLTSNGDNISSEKCLSIMEEDHENHQAIVSKVEEQITSPSNQTDIADNTDNTMNQQGIENITAEVKHSSVNKEQLQVELESQTSEDNLTQRSTLAKDEESIETSLHKQPIDVKANDALNILLDTNKSSSQRTESEEEQLPGIPNKNEKEINDEQSKDQSKLKETSDAQSSLLISTSDEINAVTISTNTGNVKESEKMASIEETSPTDKEIKLVPDQDAILSLDKNVAENNNTTDSTEQDTKSIENISENKEPTLEVNEENVTISGPENIDLNANEGLVAQIPEASLEQPSVSSNDTGDISKDSIENQNSNQLTDDSTRLLENPVSNLLEMDNNVKITNQTVTTKDTGILETNTSMEPQERHTNLSETALNMEEPKIEHSVKASQEQTESVIHAGKSMEEECNLLKDSEQTSIEARASKETKETNEKVGSNEYQTSTEIKSFGKAEVTEVNTSLTSIVKHEAQPSGSNEELLTSDNKADSLNRSSTLTEHIETKADVAIDKKEIPDILKSFLNSERNHLYIKKHPTNSVLDEETILSDIPYEIFEEPCIRKTAYQTIDSRDDDANDASDLDNNSDDSLSSKTAKILKTDLVIEKMRMRRLSTINGHGDSLEKFKVSSSSFDEAVIGNLNPIGRVKEAGEILQSSTAIEVAAASDSSSQADDVAYGELQAIPSTRETLSKDLQTTEDEHHCEQEAVNFVQPLESLNKTPILDSDPTETIKHKMLAYSVLEEGQSMDSKLLSHHDMNEISTALVDNGDTSTETESTLVTAVTIVRALTGFQSDRKNMKSKSSTSDTNAVIKDTRLASFGNAAITESLEYLVREAAAKTIQTAFRRYHYLTKRSQPKNNAAGAQDYAHRRQALLAQKRSMLQRGDAVISSSTPSPGHSNIITPMSTSYCTHSCCLLQNDGPTSPRVDTKLKWLKLRQNSMPVQIQSEVFRILPKHINKRVQSAGSAKDSQGKSTRYRRNLPGSPNK